MQTLWQSVIYWFAALVRFCSTHQPFAWVCVVCLVLFFGFRIWYKERRQCNKPEREVKPHNKLHYPDYEDWYDANH